MAPVCLPYQELMFNFLNWSKRSACIALANNSYNIKLSCCKNNNLTNPVYQTHFNTICFLSANV
jgi:hypothetical protein